MSTAANGAGNVTLSPYAQSQIQQTQTAEQASLDKYAPIAIADLNSGNYQGALQAGLDSGAAYKTNYNNPTQDPLLQALESSQGLQELDPSKTWDPNSIGQYYSAFGSIDGSGASWGKNPFGDWGDMSKLGADATANANTQGDNSAPDLERFAGATPTQSFLSKYGTTIAALAATALSFGAAAPAVAGALAADGVSTLAAGAIGGAFAGGLSAYANSAITGKDLTLGGLASSVLGGAAGGGLTNLAGGAINDATGFGSTVSTGLAGAGIGAARAGLAGGNVGLGALTGGIGGAVQGSGIAGNISSTLNNAGVPNGLSGALAKGGVGYAVGGLTGLASGALFGGGSNGASGAVAGNAGGAQVSGSTLSQGAQGNTSGISSGGGYSTNGVGTGASTDSSLTGTITGALPGVLQGAAGVYGAQNAAEAQTNADNNAIQTQVGAMGNINNIWGTQAATGQGADKALSSSLGLGGQPADPSNFLNMPGYQFAVSQGTQAIQRQAAAMGNAYTPNTAEAVGQYVTGTAAQDYNTYINQLMGAAGLGTTANQGLQTGTQTTANNISTLQQNQGQAQATGVSSSANAVGGALSGVTGTSLVGAASKLLGGSGSSSSAGGGANGSGVFNGSSPFGTPTSQDPFGSNYSNYNSASGAAAANQQFVDPNSLTTTGIDPDSFTMPNISIPDYGTEVGDATSFLGGGF